MGIATLSTVLAAGGAVAAYVTHSVLSSLRANIRAAERSGFPYVIARKYLPRPR